MAASKGDPVVSTRTGTIPVFFGTNYPSSFFCSVNSLTEKISVGLTASLLVSEGLHRGTPNRTPKGNFHA